MAAILQATFLNEFSWKKIFLFWFNFYLSLYNWQWGSIGSDNGLVLNRNQWVNTLKYDFMNDPSMQIWDQFKVRTQDG